MKAATLAALGVVAALLVAAPSAAAPPPGYGQLVGRVEFDDGTPAAGAALVLTPGNHTATASPEGLFEFEVPAGAYTVRATAGPLSAERNATVEAGAATTLVIRIAGRAARQGGADSFPFAFLALSMIAVAAGGFYVNRRMAQTGLDFNKSVLGGAAVRKPFRRRRKRPPPSAP